MSAELEYLKKWHIYAIQILFAVSISIGSQSISLDNASQWGAIVARYVVWRYLIRASVEAIALTYNALRSRGTGGTGAAGGARGPWGAGGAGGTEGAEGSQLGSEYLSAAALAGAAAALLAWARLPWFTQDFLYVLIADLLVKYPDMVAQKREVSYGTGMACSFFEGYLTHVIPSDGHRFVGFEENIRTYEAAESIRFPVWRLFIVITKDLYCPPDLKEFNLRNRPDLPYLESCKSLEDVQKSVAGVKNRIYRNSAYKIHRNNAPEVYVAAECATPLHTLHLVLKKQALFTELQGINTGAVVGDFCAMLTAIVRRSPECRGKCELIYYDNTDPNVNLADLILDRIRELQPNFEDVIRSNEE